ncbi:hypothetical protein LTR91_026542, partial [Friedmanniomyces endolithicus]
ARCPDIRKMSYRPGSEDALELLARRHWQSIEILELSGLAVEPATLRIVLASLPTLRVLTLSEMDWLDDSIFQPSPGQLPDFPPVQSLRLESTPGVTAEGLSQWLSVPQNREALTSISLQSTGITVQDLHHILWQASQLQHLSISETVSKSLSLATTSLPPLTSISLRTLHFEITSSEDVHGLQKPAESYYAYLASSLHQNALPALITLYVRDPDFPELLLLPPVMQPFATSDNGGMNAGSLRSKPSDLSSYTSNSLHNGPKGTASNTRGALSGTGFTQTLEVFSKGLDELEWVFTSIAPTPSPSWDPHNTNSPRKNSTFSSSGGRPLSAYSAGRGLGPQWAQGGFGGEARKSVIVGNGFGGFLAVPQEEVPRPMTSDGGAGAGGGVRMDGVGETRWGSFGSAGTGGSAGPGSLLKPPPSLGSLGSGGDVGKRGSRHDLWR